MGAQGVTQEEFERMRRTVRAALPGFRLLFTMRRNFYVRVIVLAGPIVAQRQSIRIRCRTADLTDKPELATLLDRVTAALGAAKAQIVVGGAGDRRPTMNYEIEMVINRPIPAAPA